MAGNAKVVMPGRNLTSFPSDIFDAASKTEKWWLVDELKSIDLSFNLIPTIPASIICVADTLLVLKMSSNRLGVLPPELVQLRALKLLDVSKNAISILPDDLSNMVSLVELNVSGNALQVLPDFSGLANLEILRCSDNSLRQLPLSVGSASRLIEVDASNNPLEVVPESIGACTRMKTLNFGRCKLHSLPVSLSRLQNLVLLDCRQNCIQQCPMLPQSNALAEVYLGLNQLQTLDAGSIVRPSISVLDVADNCLTVLPYELRFCKNLLTLDVSNNELNVLPAFLGFLPGLTRIAVEGNPLRTMKRSLIGPGVGAPALKAYLRTRASVEEAALYERELSGKAPAAVVGVESDLRQSVVPDQHMDGGYAQDRPRTSATAAVPASSQVNNYSCVAPSSGAGAVNGGAGSLPQRGTAAAAQAAQQAYAADNQEFVDAAWTAAIRESASSGGKLVLQASAFPAPLRAFSSSDLQRGRIDLSGHVTSIMADGHEITDSGVPGDLLSTCPLLSELSLSRNKLGRVPPAVSLMSISRLRLNPAGLKLHTLVLSFNNITSDGIGLLPPSLQLLDLRHNRLQSIPVTLWPLSRLHTLLLGNNQIAMPDDASGQGVGHDGATRPISDVDDALWIPSLRHLDLSYNRLARLPASVLALPSLGTLDITSNELSQLPAHLGVMTSLTALAFEGNPQRSVRHALSVKGTGAVLAYLRSRIPSGTESAYTDAYSGMLPGGVHGQKAQREAAAAAASKAPDSVVHVAGPQLQQGPGPIGAAQYQSMPAHRGASSFQPEPQYGQSLRRQQQQQQHLPSRMAHAPSDRHDASGHRPAMQRGAAAPPSDIRYPSSLFPTQPPLDTGLRPYSSGPSGAAYVSSYAPQHQLSASGYGPQQVWNVQPSTLPHQHAPYAAAVQPTLQLPVAASSAYAVGHSLSGVSALGRHAPGPGGSGSAEHAEILLRIDAVSSSLQSGCMSAAQVTAAKRELALLRAAEVRARQGASASGGYR